jgi:hypothetical protein
MLMFTRTHARLAASDAKKIGEQAKLIAKLRAERDEVKATSEKVFRANLKLAADLQESKRRHRITEIDACNHASHASCLQNEIDRLDAKLMTFTGPRPRGAGGKFVSTKGAQA